MAYVDYTYYTGTYGGGAIPSTAFTRLENKAESKVKYFTENVGIDSTADYMGSVKGCICEIAEEIYKYESAADSTGATLKSYSNDGESGTYDDSMTEQSVNKRIVSLIYQYLGSTGLLYRGCYHA